MVGVDGGEGGRLTTPPLVESARCLDGIRDDDAPRDQRGEAAQPSRGRGFGQVVDPCSTADGVLLVLVDEDTGDLQSRVVVGRTLSMVVRSWPRPWMLHSVE